MIKNRVIIVTGLSGAGRTTALKIFEDIGYEAVDNLPSSLFTSLIKKGLKGMIAIGIDVRSRDFDGKKIADFIIQNKSSMNINLVFFDCENNILINRYKESRRPHPLKLDIPIQDTIKQERIWLEPLKKISDFNYDTSNLTVPDLGKILNSYFALNENLKLNLRVLSFGYKHGLPREADIIVDMRFVQNPYYVSNLKHLTGKDKEVIKYIELQKIFEDFFISFLDLQRKTLPFFLNEGKKFVTIAFGCTGGIHRSVVMADKFYNEIITKKIDVSIDHRDIKR